MMRQKALCTFGMKEIDCLLRVSGYRQFRWQLWSSLHQHQRLETEESYNPGPRLQLACSWSSSILENSRPSGWGWELFCWICQKPVSNMRNRRSSCTKLPSRQVNNSRWLRIQRQLYLHNRLLEFWIPKVRKRPESLTIFSRERLEEPEQPNWTRSIWRPTYPQF